MLACQFWQNWNGRINLCMVIVQEETTPVALAILEEQRDLARLPANTRIILLVGSFWDALPQSPPADLSFLG